MSTNRFCIVFLPLLHCTACIKIASGEWRPYTPHGETRYRPPNVNNNNNNNDDNNSVGNGDGNSGSGTDSSIYAISSSPYTTVYIPADSAAAAAYVVAGGGGGGADTGTVGSKAKTTSIAALSSSHRTSVVSR